MLEPADLDRYLVYLRAVGEAFHVPRDRPFAQKLSALVEARRLARRKAGLTAVEVERLSRAVEWARAHASEIDAAERRAEDPFVT